MIEHDYREVILLKKVSFQNVFCPHKSEKAGVFIFVSSSVR